VNSSAITARQPDVPNLIAVAIRRSHDLGNVKLSVES
jgi:hypothetical protein